MSNPTDVAMVAAPDARVGEHTCAVIRMLPDTAPIVLSDVTAPSGKIRKVDLRAWLRAEAEVH